MSELTKPNSRPENPNFSSGPCAKRPGYSLQALEDACLGRSHLSKPGKAKLAEAIDRTRAVLGVPESYHIGIVPASDTGAYEMAMWNMLGARGLDILGWESFGKGWITDAVKQLKSAAASRPRSASGGQREPLDLRAEPQAPLRPGEMLHRGDDDYTA